MRARVVFVSGDVGYLDPDGFLFLCDRSKDLFMSGGVNIFAAEIEGQLHKMQAVVDCAVFGIPMKNMARQSARLSKAARVSV
ncbi:hypothetical protein [Bradyrhizobium sp. SHOUNA76]|uniref:hypothetical protein n=1 Tax=Bradyrhizobium sp. SHOUNA76 TaxID=2908927 RepID=UPI001FF2FF0F|nr:hypothetical protein [Bradyrhizobium sp. SHOUNA76]MCJ9700820.1 hypothetical protein [Bradyrhizobium sp. SHOUNA76]